MTDQVHVVTSLPTKGQKRRRAAGKVTFYGIYAAGLILLVDDVVKTVQRKRSAKTDDTKSD